MNAPVDGQAHFLELRRWVQSTLSCGHPIRDAHYRMALSACVHRLLKYGPDKVLDTYNARDLLNLLVYLNGHLAELVMRTAFTRAIIEKDDLVVDHLAALAFFPECRAWYWRLVEALLGGSAEGINAWLAEMTGEQLAVARLMVSRVYPDTVHTSWLQDLPDNPRLQAELCQMLALKKDYRSVVRNYLREHPAAKYCVPQEYWLRL